MIRSTTMLRLSQTVLLLSSRKDSGEFLLVQIRGLTCATANKHSAVSVPAYQRHGTGRSF